MASACDSGLALLLIALVVLERTDVFHTGRELLASLVGLLAVFVAVDAFFIGCELLTMGYPGAHEAHALSITTSGVTAPFFWFEIVAGLLAPFLILVFAKNRQKTVAVLLACALIVRGVLCKRIWLLFTSFVTPNIQAGFGVTAGTRTAQVDPAAMWAYAGSYAPTTIEVVIAIAVVCLGAIAFTVLAKLLCPKVESAA